MRNIIDAHVHIAPEHLLGRMDHRYPTTVLTFGRKLEWDGTVSQFMPDYIENSAFPARVLIHCMDRAGIGRAVILQSPCLSFNGDVAEAVRTYPDRLCGAMIVDPADDGCLREMRRWHAEGLTAVKFEMSEGLGLSHPNMYPRLRFDSPLFERIWALAEELGLTVAVDPGPVGKNGCQPEELRRMASTYPGVRLVICHLGYPEADLKNDPAGYGLWRKMADLAELKNVWFDAASLPVVLGGEMFPFAGTLSLMREFADRYGSYKLLWGTDIPGALTHATVRQLIDALGDSPMFTEEEKELIFRTNAEKAYF